MSRVWTVARREWLEQRRQPAMLAAIGGLYLLIGLVVVVTVGLLDFAAADLERARSVARMLPGSDGDPVVMLRDLAETAVGIANWLIFTQFLGIVAVLAGHAVLHDRQSATLPFLLLAPVSRAELLLGKILGALGTPLVLYLVVSGAAALLLGQLPITAGVRDHLPPSPAWLVAFLLGGPLWSLFIAAVCAVVSSLARDVRTAQQAVWFLMFFATFLCGYLLAVRLSDGVLAQLAIAGVGGACTAAAVGIGAQVISRDLAR